jgi:hypothetical protein
MNKYFNLIIVVMKTDEERLDYNLGNIFEILKTWSFKNKNFMDHVAFVFTKHNESNQS